MEILILYRKSKERELQLLPLLCNKDRISIDVGAAFGLYLAPMAKYSKHCVAFEPRPVAKQNLESLFRDSSNVTLQESALSDYEGMAELHIFRDDENKSTIEKDNHITSEASFELMNVNVIKLDNYQFKDSIGFIKIDVEGHEENVFRGSLKILKSDHPNILVEIEDQHKSGSFNRVKTLLATEGYNGFFYRDHKLHSIKNVEILDLQNMQFYGTDSYINNFIFIHEDKVEKFSSIIGAYN